MSRSLERRVAKLAATETILRLGHERWQRFVIDATKAASVDDLSSEDRDIIDEAEQELMRKTANIYLDIDGVLLNGNKPAIGLSLFLRVLHHLGNDVYWLTTHCNGDAGTAAKYIQPHLKSVSSKAIVEQFKPTTWTVKTQGIDFNKPFIWFDDKPLGWADKDTMEKHDAVDNLIIVNLKKNPFALLELAFQLRRLLKRATRKKIE